MPQLDDDLKNDIKKGVSLSSPNPEDLKRREEEKEKRRQELEKVKEALGEK
ncbi:MAG: hypothetical protein ACFFAN_15015 [Promethearchaeota archaeon]